jgi:hypothetical protein
MTTTAAEGRNRRGRSAPVASAEPRPSRAAALKGHGSQRPLAEQLAVLEIRTPETSNPERRLTLFTPAALFPHQGADTRFPD